MVKPEYKQTEIGVLPESWDTITFEDCFTILPNNTLSRAELNCNGGEVRNIHYGDILVKFTAVLDCSAEGLPYINKENVVKASKGFLRDGDLIMADTAEDVIVGKSTEVIGIGDSKVVSGLHTIPCRPKDAEMFAPKWLGYFINHCTYHDQLIPYITGIKVSSVSKSAISSTVIAVPPKPEQEAIAEALSDIDDLIANLEKLIAKKKAIKQGAMQELLTGKRRLPGFLGDWTKCVLTDVANLMTDTIPVSDIDYRYYIGTDNMVSNRGGIKQNRIELQYAVVRRYIVNDILLSNIRPYLKKIWFANINGGCSSDVLVIRVKSDGKVLAGFLYQLLSQDAFFDEVTANAVGTKMPRGDKNIIKAYPLYIPVDLGEQREILRILAEMQIEVENLEKNLNKYRQIKQGMMSELLTGRIRLL